MKLTHWTWSGMISTSWAVQLTSYHILHLSHCISASRKQLVVVNFIHKASCELLPWWSFQQFANCQPDEHNHSCKEQSNAAGYHRKHKCRFNLVPVHDCKLQLWRIPSCLSDVLFSFDADWQAVDQSRLQSFSRKQKRTMGSNQTSLTLCSHMKGIM